MSYLLSRGKLFRGAFGVVILVVAVLISFNAQTILDYARVYQYQPTPEIYDIATQISFSDRGKFLFFTGQPVIEKAAEFNKYCISRNNDTTLILGCYVVNTIHIYDVPSQQITSVKPVTAAHEMLHVAYERLSPQEKERVDRLLMDEYSRLKSDSEFESRVKSYRESEPGELFNELHSIIGTEVSSISPDLEEYYSKYFLIRSKVVNLYQSYRNVFNKLTDQIDQLSLEADRLFVELKQHSQSYENEVAEFKSKQLVFNRRASQGDFTSLEQFQSERKILLAKFNRLEAKRLDVASIIDNYNSVVEQINKLAADLNILGRSLDSKQLEKVSPDLSSNG